MREGDIVNVDITVYKDDWHGDTSRMFLIGDCSIKAQKLVKVTYEALMKGISILKNGILDLHRKSFKPIATICSKNMY